MRALLILAAVVAVTVVLPLLGVAIRAMLRRPLTPEQVEREKMVEERRRDARYFWR
jgi:hypothetical protein